MNENEKLEQLLDYCQTQYFREQEEWEENERGEYPEGMDINDAKMEVLEQIISKIKGLKDGK